MSEFKSICLKCLQPIDPEEKVEIGGCFFHKKCCQCCMCQKVPEEIKLFQCGIYCPECYEKYVMGQYWQSWQRWNSFQRWRSSNGFPFMGMPPAGTTGTQAQCDMMNEFMRSPFNCSRSPIIFFMNQDGMQFKFPDMPSCSSCGCS